MVLEASLAYLHILAILAWVVFASSQAALCHAEWLSPTTIRRLVRLDGILWGATAAILLAGLARAAFGVKGISYYGENWLLYTKVVLFLAVIWLQLGASRAYRRWLPQSIAGTLPPAPEVQHVHRRVMWATHLLAVIPLPAVFLARGFGAW